MGTTILAVDPGALPPAVLERLGDIVVTAYEAIGALEGDDEYVPELRDIARRVREVVVFAALDAAGDAARLRDLRARARQSLGRAPARRRGLDPDAGRRSGGAGTRRRLRAGGGVPGSGACRRAHGRSSSTRSRS